MGRIAERLLALRGHMSRLGLDVYLVPSIDEHHNEFPPLYKLRREAISGFTGSAGDVAVTADAAHLFVDSRYHLQAESQAPTDSYQVHRLGLAGVVDLPAFLASLNPPAESKGGKKGGRPQPAAATSPPLRVGYDPFLFTMRSLGRLNKALQDTTTELVPVEGNLVDLVWQERPAPPDGMIQGLPDHLTGESFADKLARVRNALAEGGAGAILFSRPDEIAWLTNLRGSDVPRNPVFESYLLLTENRAVLFTDRSLEEASARRLEGLLETAPYEGFREAVRGLAAGDARVWFDPVATSEGVRLLIVEGLADSEKTAMAFRPNPVQGLKALKNPVEIEVSRQAHLRAGAAKVRAFARLEGLLAGGTRVSEADFAAILAEEYATEEGFYDLSFDTICGFGPNGAIVHYGTPSPQVWLEPPEGQSGGLLLVDSGVQLAGATTDDTRTIIVGEPSQEQRERFTAVLRGHIRLAAQVFPDDTSGQTLDSIARSALWNEGHDYGHGTGHGVGAFLNVHEGPHSISTKGKLPLEPGVVISIEPGYYRQGWGGIRCENLYVVEEALGLPHHPAGKSWLRFNPLTMIPFDSRLTDRSLMAADEQRWLDGYHGLVWQGLSPLLSGEALAWLARQCGIED
ncbi:MAG: aminopeptidase P family protein [Deltaproteobacteria bacterium]|nr:aminopeptidase P family protein [Deltaproteobacteria bacterium]